MKNEPMAFISYARIDDDLTNNTVTNIAKHLSNEVTLQIGREFKVFQDKTGINWGDNWKNKIEDSLDKSTFLIPIISPSFFQSQACREEVDIFLKKEKLLEGTRLILPIYFITAEEIDNDTKMEQDEIALALCSRQYFDLRKYRFLSIQAQEFQQVISDLAETIVDVIRKQTPQTEIDKTQILRQKFEVMKPSERKPIKADIQPNMLIKLPSDFQICEVFRLKITDSDSDEYLIIGEMKTSGGFSCVLLSWEEKRWRKVFQNNFERYPQVALNNMLDTDKDVLIISSSGGSGNFMNYIVFGEIDKRIKVLLERDTIFQGHLIIGKSQIIEKSGGQAILFRWSEDRITGTTLVSEPHVPFSMSDVRLRYSVTTDGRVNTQTTNVTLPVGSKLVIIRENTGTTDRILFPGTGVITQEGETLLASKTGESKITIVPDGYNWDEALDIDVTVVNQ